MIAAFCPKCGGWTMWHGDDQGQSAREWSASCARMGEIVILCKPEALGGESCPQTEVRVADRTCDQPVPAEVDDAA